MRILLAYDGSPPAEAALDQAIGRPWPPGSEMRLVMVVERPAAVQAPEGSEVYAPLYARMRASLREQAYHRIQTALGKLKGNANLQATYELRDGKVKEALLDAIQEWRPDLVIAGSRGASRLARLMLGSVSHALVTHAPCSVEIVKLQASR